MARSLLGRQYRCNLYQDKEESPLRCSPDAVQIKLSELIVSVHWHSVLREAPSNLVWLSNRPSVIGDCCRFSIFPHPVQPYTIDPQFPIRQLVMSDAVPRNQFQHQLKPVPLLASSFQAEVPYACPVKLDSGASEVHVRLQEVTMYNIRDPVSGGIKSNYGIAYLRLNGVGWFHVENGLGLVFEHFRGLQNSAIVKSGQQILTTQYWGKVKQSVASCTYRLLLLLRRNLLRAYGYDDAKTYVEPYEAMYREYQVCTRTSGNLSDYLCL